MTTASALSYIQGTTSGPYPARPGNLVRPLIDGEAIARRLGYSLLQATVVSTNEAEIHILEKFGWKRGASFTNRRTGNDVIVYFKDLNQ